MDVFDRDAPSLQMLQPMLREMLLGEWMICYDCSRQVWIKNQEHTRPNAVTDDDYLCASCELVGGMCDLDHETEQLNYSERMEYCNDMWPLYLG